MEGGTVRRAIFEQISKEMNVKLKSLKTLSTTRWAHRVEANQAVKKTTKSSCNVRQKLKTLLIYQSLNLYIKWPHKIN